MVEWVVEMVKMGGGRLDRIKRAARCPSPLDEDTADCTVVMGSVG